MCKDVECMFGILKKQWKIMDSRFKHRSMKICSEIFVSCCCLHNIMLDMMQRMAKPPRVGRGMPIGTDGMWLGNPTDLMQREELMIVNLHHSGVITLGGLLNI
jgi:hypothetical protein